MKKVKEINKMLEGYTLGRPKSRQRKFKNIDIILQSDYGAMTVYAYDMNNTQILFKKVFYNSWFDAFYYYYNTIENKINNHLKAH